jgi:predicted membrane protein
MQSKNCGFKSGLIVGLFAIAAGVVILLDRSGVINAGHVFRFWPLILVALGFNGALHRDSAGHHGGSIASGILALWGLLLLAQNFGYLTWGQIWPIVLIVVGVVLLWSSFRARTPAGMRSAAAQSRSVFSGIEKDITDRDFQSGSAQAVFGSVEYDFTQADMAGDKGYLDVDVAFGSVEVRIPTSWNVAIETAVVFGSAENKTRPPVTALPSKTLVIRGRVVFGSVEVKN